MAAYVEATKYQLALILICTDDVKNLDALCIESEF